MYKCLKKYFHFNVAWKLKDKDDGPSGSADIEGRSADSAGRSADLAGRSADMPSGSAEEPVLESLKEEANEEEEAAGADIKGGGRTIRDIIGWIFFFFWPEATFTDYFLLPFTSC